MYKTTVKFFNACPSHIYTQSEFFKNQVGKTVKMTKMDMTPLGEATILDVEYVDDGVWITYETDVSFDVMLFFK